MVNYCFGACEIYVFPNHLFPKCHIDLIFSKTSSVVSCFGFMKGFCCVGGRFRSQLSLGGNKLPCSSTSGDTSCKTNKTCNQ